MRRARAIPRADRIGIGGATLSERLLAALELRAARL